MSIKIEKCNKKITVKTPYSRIFIREARKLNGKWDNTEKVWVFDTRDEKKVREICLNIYGNDGISELEKVDVIIDLDNVKFENQLYICGILIASRPSRDRPVSLYNTIILEGAFPASGGSMKYPNLEPEIGTILEARDIPVNIAKKVVEENPKGFRLKQPLPENEILLKERERLMNELKIINNKLNKTS